MGNARLDEAQAGIKISGRNINNVSQMRPSPLSVNKALLESALAVHPCIMYGCLHTAATGQSGHDSDHKAQNTEKLVVWLFIEKVC